MKTSTLIFLLTSVFFCFSFTILASSPEKPESGITENSDLKTNSGRLFKGCNFYQFDRLTNEFVKIKNVNYEDLPELNTRIHDIINLRPNGGIAGEGKLIIRGDSHKRDTTIEKWDNFTAGSNLSIVEKTLIKYGITIDKPTDKQIFTMEDELRLTSFVKWNFDENFNLTSQIKEDYSYGTLVNIKADSFKIEYNNDNQLVTQTMLDGKYNYENSTAEWTPNQKEIIEWIGENLKSVTISELNDDGTEKQLSFKIDEIEGADNLNPVDWRWASSFKRYKWKEVANGIGYWEDFEYENNTINGRDTVKIVKRWEGDGYYNWTKTENVNLQYDLYELNKFHIDRLNVDNHFRDHLKYTGTLEGDWELNSASSRIQIVFGLSFSLKTDNKNALVGDSILTLTRQIYDAGSGEWLDDFKQEFFFESIATSTDDIEIDNKVTLFPNPSNGILNISFTSVKNLTRFDIVNSVGQTISSENISNFLGNYTYNKDLSHLNRGIYFIKFYTENRVVSKKFILQ